MITVSQGWQKRSVMLIPNLNQADSGIEPEEEEYKFRWYILDNIKLILCKTALLRRELYRDVMKCTALLILLLMRYLISNHSSNRFSTTAALVDQRFLCWKISKVSLSKLLYLKAISLQLTKTTKKYKQGSRLRPSKTIKGWCCCQRTRASRQDGNLRWYQSINQ